MVQVSVKKISYTKFGDNTDKCAFNMNRDYSYQKLYIYLLTLHFVGLYDCVSILDQS